VRALGVFFSASKDDSIDSYRYRTFLCGLPLQISSTNSKLGLKKCVLEDVKCIELTKNVLQCC
jgi:hypothetical protein